jgi:hypothetical protein
MSRFELAKGARGKRDKKTKRKYVVELFQTLIVIVCDQEGKKKEESSQVGGEGGERVPSLLTNKFPDRAWWLARSYRRSQPPTQIA